MIEASPKTLPWLETGYARFAMGGPKALRIEDLARRVGKSKSSFYHHFADLDVFQEQLLRRHRERILQMAERERACTQMVPDLLEVLLEFKEDLLFHRQLRIHPEVPAFRACSEWAAGETANTIVTIWAAYLGLDLNSRQSELILSLAIENFFLHLRTDDVSYAWLLAYVEEMRGKVRGILG